MDDLVIDSERGVDNNRVVATYYKSVSPCMEIRKMMIQSSLPWTSRIPDRLSSVRAVEYYFTFFGVSKKEILDSNNRRYLFDDIVFSSEEVERAFNALLKLEIIRQLGSLDGIIRYSISDEQLRDFVCECCNITGLLYEIIERKFLSDKVHSTRRVLMRSIRDWVELFRSKKYADNMLDYLMTTEKDKRGDDLFIALKNVQYLYSLVDKQIDRIRIEYKEIINRYGYLAESIIELARPESLRNAIDKIDIGTNNLCSITPSQKNKIKSILSNNMNLGDVYDTLKYNGFPQYCYNTLIQNAGFVLECKCEDSELAYFIRKSKNKTN